MADKQKAMLIKTYREKYRSTDGKSLYEKLIIIYRNEHGKKFCKCVDRPKSTYYILKDKNDPEVAHSPAYVGIDKVNKIEIESDKLFRDIAERTGTIGFYDKVCREENKDQYSSDMKNLFRLPEIYNADLDIEDQYIARFYREFELCNVPLHKVYYDIETDTYPNGLNKPPANIGVPSSQLTPAPINIITLLDGLNKDVYSFILNNPKNESLQDFKLSVDDFKRNIKEKIMNDSLSFTEYAKEEIDALEKKYNYDETNTSFIKEKEALYAKLKESGDITSKFIPNKIDIKFYDDEKNLIIAFFDKIHEIDPDYAFGWNSANFDFRYLVNRLKKLFTEDKVWRENNKDVDPSLYAQAMVCDKKYMYHNVNGKNISFKPIAYCSFNERQQVGERFSSTKIVDGINWIDQMELYGVVHSGEGVKDSYALDAISNALINNEKLEFDKGDVTNAAWYNFAQFTEYNIRDGLLLFLLDDYLEDCSLLDIMSQIMYVRKEKAFSQSIALQNFVSFLCIENNTIMNSNKNRSYGNEMADYFEANYLRPTPIMESDPRYLKDFDIIDSHGALCSDPTLNNKVGIELMKGVKSMYLFNNVIDFDFAALYPSIFSTFNIDTMMLIGRYYIIDDRIKNRITNLFNGKKIATNTDNLSEELVDVIMSQDWNTLGTYYMELPSVEEMISELDGIVKKTN